MKNNMNESNVVTQGFALLNEPMSYQLSVRLSNLIATYGSVEVSTWLEEVLNEKEPLFYDDEIRWSIPIYTNLVQTVRYFGEDTVKSYWNAVYTKKVA